MAPSSTNGATRPVVRSPHRKVVVCQCPCGTVQTRRSPFGAHPRAGVNQIDLARRWRVRPRTLERWRWLKQGPAYLKIGNHVVYREEDVLTYEAAQRRHGQAV